MQVRGQMTVDNFVQFVVEIGTSMIEMKSILCWTYM